MKKTGTTRPDVIRGTAYADTLSGLGGADRIYAYAGNDVVHGGLGADTILAGLGNDTIRVRDGVRDVVKCGPGTDRVVADRLDILTDCETVTRP